VGVVLVLAPVPTIVPVAPPVPATSAPLVPAGSTAVALGLVTALAAVAFLVPAGSAPVAVGPGITPGVQQVEIVV